MKVIWEDWRNVEYEVRVTADAGDEELQMRVTSGGAEFFTFIPPLAARQLADVLLKVADVAEKEAA